MSETQQLSQEQILDPQIWKKIQEKISQIQTCSGNQEINILCLPLKLEINSNQQISQPQPQPQPISISLKNEIFSLINLLINNQQQQNIETGKFNLLTNHLCQIARDLVSRKNYSFDEAFQIADQILAQFIFFVGSYIDKIDHLILSETFKSIMDITRPFYKNNNQDLEGFIPLGYEIEIDQQRQDWLNQLKVNDMVDVVKYNRNYKEKACWSRAQILEVKQDNDNKIVRIGYLCDHVEEDREINLNSSKHWEIAPYQSMSDDFEWRINLKEGDQLDVCDTSNIWTNSTVKRTRKIATNRGEVILVEIGYRIFKENGNQFDEKVKKHYEGWNSQYDEELPATDPRIQKFNKMAKELFKKASTDKLDENAVDDSFDIIFDKLYQKKKFYAIQRNQISKSISYINYINKFGESGGFDNFLKRIQDTQNWIPVEFLTNYLAGIGSMSEILSRQFAYEFVPKLKDILRNNIIGSPDQIIRQMETTKIESIKNNFGNLLKRYFSLKQKKEIIEKFQLDLALLCFNSQFLQQNVNGIRMINQIIYKLSQNVNHRILLSDQLVVKWIQQNKIFERIFLEQDNTHSQLIQRSEKFVKFMLQQKIITNDHIQIIWDLMLKHQNNKDLQHQIFKVLKEVSAFFQIEHVDFIVQKISQLEPENLKEDHIQLVYEISKELKDEDSQVIDKVYNFLWNLICNSSHKIDKKLLEIALTKFGYLANKMNDSQQKYNYLKQSVQNIKKNISVNASMSIFKQLIESYPNKQNSQDLNDKNYQGGIILQLSQEEQITSIILSNILYLKQQFKQKADQNLKEAFQEQTKYLNKLEERLQFISFIYNKHDVNDQSIKYQVLSDLWDILISNSYFSDESDILYEWLMKFDKQKNIIQFITLFEEKLLTGNKNNVILHNFSEKGYGFFQNIFSIINTHFHNLIQISDSESKKQYTYNDKGQITSISSNNQQYQIHFAYELNQEPQNLLGIKALWEISLRAENVTVQNISNSFITKLYTNLNANVQHKTQSINKQFLENCISQIDFLNSQNLQQETIQQQMKVAFNLIQNFLYESEKFGNGGLISHKGLVKGELFSLTIKNEYPNNNYNTPKQFEIKINSNKTLLDLKEVISQKINISSQNLKVKGKVEFDDTCNGKLLTDLNIRNTESIIVQKKQIHVQKAELLDNNGNLLEKPKQIFTEWFFNFSENNIMGAQQISDYIGKVTKSSCNAQDNRVQRLIQEFDRENKGYIVLDEFLLFYQKAAQDSTKVHNVWNNLKNMDYREDLKHLSEGEFGVQDIELMPRYILKENDAFYQLLFEITAKIQNQDLGLIIWNLLNHLPPNKEIVKNVKQLQGVVSTEQQQPDWSFIFNDNQYKLLYTLTIIEYMLEIDEETDEKLTQNLEKNLSQNSQMENEDLDKAQSNNEKHLEQLYLNKQKQSYIQKDQNWMPHFINLGGFKQLFKLLQDVLLKIKTHQKQNENQQNDTILKQTLQFTLRIIQTYLVPSLAEHTQNLYVQNKYVTKMQFPLEEINENLNQLEQEQQNQTKNQDQENNQSNNNLNKTNNNKAKITEPKDFIQISKKLKGELGNNIINSFDLQNLCLQVCESLSLQFQEYNQKNKYEQDLDGKNIISINLTILISILLYSENALNYLVKEQTLFENVILTGLFLNSRPQIRKYFSRFLFVLSRKYKGAFQDWLVNILIKNVPHQSDESKTECNQYYDILCKLIEYRGSNDTQINFEELLNVLIQNIIDCKSQEKRYPVSRDLILRGFLNLCEKILKIKPELAKKLDNFAIYIIQNLLFAIQPEELLKDLPEFIDLSQQTQVEPEGYVKCKQNDTRKMAQKILVQILRQNKKMLPLIIQNYLTPLAATMHTYQGWGYQPTTCSRSVKGFVGIKNLSNICYMNAMMQQFFMTPCFRYGILVSDDKKEQQLTKYDGTKKEFQGVELDDNILHQLQKMFAYLELSDRQDYNPYQFCYSFKDYSGNPVNISVQQDSQEFLNQIFDKLDNSLKDTPWRHLLQGVFGGKTCSQLICQSCGNIKENIEIFYSLSLTVKNMNSLQESLKHMIEGETINDYFCEKCSKKQDTTKRVLVNNMPNVLIIHLQRIVFDLDTLMNDKINSRLEFPEQLNMLPYTKKKVTEIEEQIKNKKQNDKNAEIEEELQNEEDSNNQEKQQEIMKSSKIIEEEQNETELDEEYLYKIKGVVVHTGTADFGHYYSFIKTDEEKWREFNDSTIKDFDPKDLEKECFGGKNNADDGFSYAKGDSSKNAYMLVYEKIKKNPIQFLFNNDQEKDEVVNSLQADTQKLDLLKLDSNSNDIEEESLQTNSDKNMEIQQNHADGSKFQVNFDYDDIKRIIPKKFYKKVWLDNHQFMLEKQTYTEEYFTFLRDLLHSIEQPDEYPLQYQIENPELISTIPQIFDESKIKQEIKQTAIQMLDFVYQQICDIIIRSNNNEILKYLNHDIIYLLNLSGDYVWEFFVTRIIKYKKLIFEQIILLSPDYVVRQFYSKLIAYIINYLVKKYNLTLIGEIDKESPNAEKEEQVRSFLQYTLSLLNKEVCESWINEKFVSYQEFIFQIVQASPAQLDWAFENQLLARIIDFFLGKDSDINDFCASKKNMGNEYSTPNFFFIINCAQYLAVRAENVVGVFGNTLEQFAPSDNIDEENQQPQKIYKLSELDKKALNNIKLYEKCIQTHQNLARLIGPIMFHQCYKNYELSKKMACLLLPNLNNLMYNQLDGTLTLIIQLITIEDEYFNDRFEMIFGYPSLKDRAYQQFGLQNQVQSVYCDYITSLNDSEYSSITKTTYLSKKQAFLSYLYESAYKYDNVTTLCLHYLSQGLQKSQKLLQKFALLPPPSYCQAKYTDWIKPFITQYYERNLKDFNSGSTNSDLKTFISHAKDVLDNFEKDILPQINLYIQKLKGENYQPTQTEIQLGIFSLYQPFIVGKTVNEEIVEQQEIEKDGLKIIKTIKDLEVYLAPSLPQPAQNITTNIPGDLFDYGKEIMFKNMHPESNIFNFTNFNPDIEKKINVLNLKIDTQLPKQSKNQNLPEENVPPPLNNLLEQNKNLLNPTIPDQIQQQQEEEKNKNQNQNQNQNENQSENENQNQNENENEIRPTEIDEEIQEKIAAAPNQNNQQKQEDQRIQEEEQEKVNAAQKTEETKEGDVEIIEETKQNPLSEQAIPIGDEVSHLPHVDFENIQTQKYIRIIEINNLSEHQVNIQAKINQTENSNFFGPQTEILKTVAPKSNCNIITLHKKIAELDFGDLNLDLNINFLENQDNQNNNNNNQNNNQIQEEDNQQNDQNLHQGPVDQHGNIVGPYSVVPYGPKNQNETQTEDINKEVACQACTLINLAILNNCEACGTALPK